MSAHPPGGWHAYTGVWGPGQDQDRETTLVELGANAVRFKSTAQPSVTLVSDYFPVESGCPHCVFGLLRADNIVGKNVYFVAVWFTAAKVQVASTTVVSGPLSAANVWHHMAKIDTLPATVCFGRIVVGRITANFNAYAAYVGIVRVPVCFSAYLNGATSYTNGQLVVFDQEDYDYGGHYAPGTGLFTAPAAGVYTFNAQIRMTNMADGNYVFLGLRLNGAIVRNSSSPYAAAGGAPVMVGGGWTLSLTRGDTVSIQVNHSFGAARTATGAAGGYHYTAFSGYRVE